MDRRLIDLELAGFEAELHRRNQTLDIPQAERMRYWLAGWKQSYGLAYDVDIDGPELSETQCLARIDDLKAYIAEREQNQDPGSAEIYGNWLRAFLACFGEATGEATGEVRAGAAADGDDDAPLSPDAMRKTPWPSRRAEIGRLTGQTPRNADDARRIYDAWYADRAAKMQAA